MKVIMMTPATSSNATHKSKTATMTTMTKKQTTHTFTNFLKPTSLRGYLASCSFLYWQCLTF